MEKQDTRHLTQVVQQHLRQQAIRLREQGKPVTELAILRLLMLLSKMHSL